MAVGTGLSVQHRHLLTIDGLQKYEGMSKSELREEGMMKRTLRLMHKLNVLDIVGCLDVLNKLEYLVQLGRCLRCMSLLV